MGDAASARTGFVLLHGAELGGWIWDRVRRHLQRPAMAVDLPGRGTRPHDPRTARFADAVAAIVEDAGHLDVARVVVVAHSFSGVLVPPVVAQLGDRVAAAVFVGAAVPRDGRGWVDLLPTPQRLLLRTLYRVRPGGVLSPAGQNRTALCHDLDADATAAVLDRRVPEPPRFLLDPVDPATLPAGLPVHYVRLTEDRTVTLPTQDAMAARLPDVRVHDLPTGHLPMLADPQALATLLEGVAAAAVR